MAVDTLNPGIYLVSALVVCFLMVLFLYAWNCLLESNPPAKWVRRVMLLVLALETGVEVWLWSKYKLHPWVIVVTAVTNTWGYLDAILRFPYVHDIDSLFSLKQVFLLVVKIAVYCFGFQDFSTHIGWFLLLMGTNVAFLPMVYFLALPLDHFESDAAALECDLLVAAWRLLASPAERRRCATQLTACWRRAAIVASKSSPLVREVLLRVSPGLRQALHKGREI